jgi:hypothetical protein
MYRFSRALYREIAPRIDASASAEERRAAATEVLRSCERAVERIPQHGDPRPLARALFRDVRGFFPLSAQERVWRAISGNLSAASASLQGRVQFLDPPTWGPRQCRATTRQGTACQRHPVFVNGYCPSHQHLADTEHSPFERAVAS